MLFEHIALLAQQCQQAWARRVEALRNGDHDSHWARPVW